MNFETAVGLLNLLIPVALLIVTYFIGSYVERRHFASIREREQKYLGFPTMTFVRLPEGKRVVESDVATGSVVISVDYFKRFLAALRGIVGGRIRSYESLLDRARREALLRMVEDASSRGFDMVINVRIETSRLASSRSDGKGIAGVELLAFGTAVKLAG